MARECKAWRIGEVQEDLRRRVQQRRERRCPRRKKEILYRGAAKRRTIGSKNASQMISHVEARVKKYFNIEELWYVRQEKRRTCVPHLHDVSTW
jgi:hypothetical protein